MLFGVSGALSSFSAHPRMPTPSHPGLETIEVFQLITHTSGRTTLKMVLDIQAEVRCSSGLVQTRPLSILLQRPCFHDIDGTKPDQLKKKSVIFSFH